MFVHSYSTIGTREKNEDYIKIILNCKNDFLDNLDILAIFDGHGGSYISELLSKSLPPFFYNKIPFKKTFDNYVKKLYVCFQKKILSTYNFAQKQGSTALFVLISKLNNKLYITTVNLGDCRAIISNKYMLAIPLSKDHKPLTYLEKKRIHKQGGVISIRPDDDPRIGQYSVSRSFGDGEESFISQEPEIIQYEYDNDNFIVVACDGLWDVLSNQEVIDFVQTYLDVLSIRKNYIETNSDNNIAKKLAEYALLKGSTDNVSIVIYFFKN